MDTPDPMTVEYWRRILRLVAKLETEILRNPNNSERYRGDVEALKWLQTLVAKSAVSSVPAPVNDPVAVIERRVSWLTMAITRENRGDHALFREELGALTFALDKLKK